MIKKIISVYLHPDVNSHLIKFILFLCICQNFVDVPVYRSFSYIHLYSDEASLLSINFCIKIIIILKKKKGSANCARFLTFKKKGAVPGFSTLFQKIQYHQLDQLFLPHEQYLHHQNTSPHGQSHPSLEY